MNAFPPHRDLDGAVQLAQSAGAPYQQTAPHHWNDPEQPDLDLHDLAPVSVSHQRGSFNDRSGRLRRSRHFTVYARLHLAVAGTPQILMLSYLVPERTVEALAGCLRRLMSDQGLCVRLGAKARSVALRFDQANIVARWEAMVHSLCHG